MIRRHRIPRYGVAALVVLASVVLLSTRRVHEPSDTPTSAGTAGNSPDPASDLVNTGKPITPTSRPHRRHDGSVLVLGDSLTIGADKAGLTRTLRADGWTVDVDADVGRSTRGGIYALQVQHPTVPSTVVVELGTNPSADIGTFAAEIDTMLSELAARGATRVLWLTPHHRDDNRYAAKSAAIEAAAAKNPMLAVADWASVAVGHREWMLADGLHYTAAGYAVLAAFIADELDALDAAGAPTTTSSAS